MHTIYNLIKGQTNEQLQQRAALDDTFQAVKTDQHPIGYLMIMKRLCFSNQPKPHPIRSLCLSTVNLYKTMGYSNNNITTYYFRFMNP